jgi:glycosyltransferase
MNEKNFNSWNELKKDLHFNEKRKYFKEADIWFVHMGQNIGYEVFGKGEKYLRPVIIFRKSGKDTFLGIPLTSKIKEDKFHVIVKFKDKINSAILNQVRTFDSKRLMYQTGKLSANEFEKIESEFIRFYNLTPSRKKGGILTKCEQRKDNKIISQKNKNIKVSIITVVYNNKDTIKDAIESVLNQTYKNIEYIIIDGGSNDGTVEIIRSYGNKIDKFISEKDNGIYDAMNKGIKLATGDIVGILNSDDFYASNDIIEKVVNEFIEKKVDSVYGDLVYVDAKNTDKIVRYWKSKPFKEGLFKKGWHPAHPTFFVKKEIYDKYGIFNLDFKIAADYELMLRFLEKCKISSSYIPEIFVKMRVGGESNQSIKNIIKANIESYKAWKANDLKIHPFRMFAKPLSKVFQYFKL